MRLTHLIVSATAAITLTLAGAVAAESHAEKAAAAAKAAEATSAAKAQADPTAANKHEAKLKTEESVDAAAVAGDMEGEAAAKEKAAESGK